MIYVWGIAKALDGRVLLRIEDHDTGRCREEFFCALYDDMKWLGFAADLHATAQSQRKDRYMEIMRSLSARQLAYGCRCTRRQIAQDSPDQSELLYPGTCRNLNLPLRDGEGWRIRLSETTEYFEDGFLGPLQQTPAKQCGDLLARDRHGQWTYQFAVVVDDLDQDISLVIRGQDLTDSTGRQIAMRSLLSERIPPVYAHHPLIVDGSGKKLSKRAMSQSITARRLAGDPPEQILSEAAHWSGVLPEPPGGLSAPYKLTLEDLLQYFRAQSRR